MTMKGVVLEPDALDRLVPMHILLDADCRIAGVGRAMRRLAGDRSLAGLPLLDAVAVEHPAGITSPEHLAGCAGRRLTVAFRQGRQVVLRGHLVPVGGGGLLLNLGLSLGELQDLGGAPLTCDDFAPTDPTVDMLYLIEAKALAFAEMRRLVARLQGAKMRAEEQASSDTLTGLRNRRALDRILARTIESGEPFSVCHVDLDHFKSVNDRLGHAAGDAVLRAVAERLLNNVRASDTVARVGGDEFTIVLPGLTDPDALSRIAARIVEDLEVPVMFEGERCHVSASIGISLSTRYETPDLALMISDADAALYLSKSGGRARHTIYCAPLEP